MAESNNISPPSTNDWEAQGFFQSLVDFLNDSENVSVANSVGKEAIAAHLEHAVLAIQQILSLVPGASECGEFLQELLKNLDCT